jgi:CheY-like chemotaxis protein
VLAVKKRIMFVDDEPAILAAMRSLLRRERDRWDMVFAPDGEVALEEARKQPFDVVISDMRMPGMDGATLLARIKQEWPATVRIMLTGHAETDAILRALSSIHQLLAKPCPTGTLRGVLERCRNLDALVGDASLLAVIGGLDKLPSPPALYVALEQLIADSRASPAQIAAIIEQDPAIAAKLLQLANSGYFGDGETICSIERAVACLGGERIGYMVLATSSFDELDGKAGNAFVNEVQRTGRATAVLVRKLLAHDVGGVAFAAALLHDLGQVVLGLGLGEGYHHVLDTSKGTRQPVAVAEQKVLGAPEETRELAGVIHVADALTQGTAIDDDSLGRAGLTDAAARWRQVASSVILS